MAFDLAISDHGDLIFGGARDLQGAFGTNLLEQRMKNRLKIPRGSWVFDRSGTLGSMLHRIPQRGTEAAISAVDAFVRQALAPMSDDIVVEKVITEADLYGPGIVVRIQYRVKDFVSGAAEATLNELALGIPTSGAGSLVEAE